MEKPPTRRRKPLPPSPAVAGPDMLLTAAEAAALLRCGLSTFWSHVKKGTMPAPVRIGPRMPRWRVRDLIFAAPQN